MYPHIFPLLSSMSRDTLSEVKIQIQSIPSNLLILQFRNFVKKEINLPYSSKDLQGNHSCSKGRASGSGALRSDWHSVSPWGQSRPWAACPAFTVFSLSWQCPSSMLAWSVTVQAGRKQSTGVWTLEWGQPSPPSMEIMASFALFGTRTLICAGRRWMSPPSTLAWSLNGSYLWTLCFSF